MYVPANMVTRRYNKHSMGSEAQLVRKCPFTSTFFSSDFNP